MNAKCFSWIDYFKDYFENNVLKIIMSITVAMVFVIANSQLLIYASIYGTWLLAFMTLFVFGYMLAYGVLSLLFRIIDK
ncbi:hypothetical protein [Companilactobacillus versmoldensis]|uniref:Uncharacterized protein n=1 Tax=Companilactobacillus versmoldensis DSM 14857 = KCTC 3814 TaxID=1423815 RepID=A0A0R1SFS3_9LACO|nr:hypothetical protein [Companilactobacillus versmoldensis]KRL68151.1 hypothetical protein FC27_GL000892 [Companilactobacillus versmoldensis DSM 14857 = KCTC 3814]